MATPKQRCVREAFGATAKACAVARRAGEVPSTRECMAQALPARASACARPAGSSIPVGQSWDAMESGFGDAPVVGSRRVVGVAPDGRLLVKESWRPAHEPPIAYFPQDVERLRERDRGETRHARAQTPAPARK